MKFRPVACSRVSELPLGECAKLVRDRPRKPQRGRTVSDRSPSEPLTDLIDGAISCPTRDAFLAAGSAPFVAEPKRQIQLQRPLGHEVRDGDRQERDGFFARMISEGSAY